MDLSNPIRSVIPGGRGEVLAVLARTDRPLTGRRVAELTDGRLSQKGTNLALRALARSGLVLVEEHPPAKLYRLNRSHLAAPSIEALSTLRDRLIAARTHARTFARRASSSKPLSATWTSSSTTLRLRARSPAAPTPRTPSVSL